MEFDILISQYTQIYPEVLINISTIYNLQNYNEYSQHIKKKFYCFALDCMTDANPVVSARVKSAYCIYINKVVISV